MSRRTLTLVVAFVLAIAMGIGTLVFLNANKPPPEAIATPAPVMKRVVVALRDIPAHIKIAPEMLSVTTKPQDQADPGSFDDTKQVVGQISLVPIASGAAVVSSSVGSPAAQGAVGKLRPGLRALTIPVDMIKAVAGLINPGDRVDILAELPRNGHRQPRSYTIMRGIQVLAINGELSAYGDASGSSPAPANASPSQVTVAVTPAQADQLLVADLNSTLRLALRSPEERMNSAPTEPLDLSNPEDTMANLPAPKPVAMPSKAPATPKPTPGVQIIMGSDVVGGK